MDDGGGEGLGDGLVGLGFLDDIKYSLEGLAEEPCVGPCGEFRLLILVTHLLTTALIVLYLFRQKVTIEWKAKLGKYRVAFKILSILFFGRLAID